MKRHVFLLLILTPLAVFIVSLFVGRYPIAPGRVLEILAYAFAPGPGEPDTAHYVFFGVRLPRILLAMMVGAGLSISGSAFQGLFRNPLVSPQILGVSYGAGFGAALAILFTSNSLVIQASAFCFGIVAVGLCYLISREAGETTVLMLVLSGIIVGAVFSASISLIKYVADPYEKLPTIVFWLMGSFSACTINSSLSAAPGILVGIIVLTLLRWRINLLSLGDREAALLGMRTEAFKTALIGAATLIVATAVSVAGIVGWVGLVVPHMTRMLVGPDHRNLLPASLCVGAAYMMIVDDLARCLTTADLPLGMVTAFVSAPFFAYLIRRMKRTGWVVQ